MRLSIVDCRLPIAGSGASGGFARGGHDCGQVVGFLQEGGELAFGNYSGFGEQLKPECSFVRFFLDCSDLRNEFYFAAGAASRAVIRRHGSSAPNDLFCHDSSRVVGLGNGPGHFDYSERKGFGALFKFKGIHMPKLIGQSPIANRQSAIKK
jgi:hypothetical protein